MDLVRWEPLRWEPFMGLERIQSRINDLFDETFGRSRLGPAATAGVWVPPVDILESNDSYLIRAELPGIKREEFNVEYRDGSLTLSGERRFDEPADGVGGVPAIKQDFFEAFIAVLADVHAVGFEQILEQFV